MGKPKILVIDDQIEMCELLQEYYTKRGYGFVYSLTGQGGVDALDVEKPDIIMLDTDVKDIPAGKVIKMVRATKKPYAVITYSVWEKNESIYIKLGADYHIQKPFSIEKVTKLIESLTRTINNKKT